MAKGYAGISSKARNITNGYVGVLSTVPTYSTQTVTKELNTNNLSSFFTVSNGTGTSGWTYQNYEGSLAGDLVTFSYSNYTSLFSTSGIGSSSTSWSVGPTAANQVTGIILTPNNYGIDSSTASATLTAKYNCVIKYFTASGTTENGWDKFTGTAGGVTYFNAISGSFSEIEQGISLSAGQSITLKYVKDSSQSVSGESVSVLIAMEAYSPSNSTSSSGGIKLVPNNFGVNSSTATIELTAKQTLTNVSVEGEYYTESGYDKITLTAGGTTYLSQASGSKSLSTFFSGKTISAGGKIIFTYTKDSSQSASGESNTFFALKCDSITTTESVQTGSTTKEVARKISKIYAGVNGVAQMIYGQSQLYTGGYIESTFTLESGTVADGIICLTSGTLTLPSGGSYYAYLIGGGSAGNSATGMITGAGGGGGNIAGTIPGPGTYQVTIGGGGLSDFASGGNTIFGNTTAEGGRTGWSRTMGGSGGCGGGSGAQLATNGVGDPPEVGEAGTGNNSGTSFTSNTPAYCGGGGGGAGYYYSSSDGEYNYFRGGNGGSDGGAGTRGTLSTSTSNNIAGTGGSFGGGNGGRNGSNGGNGNAYGGAGGGGSVYYNGNFTNGSAGQGAAGAVFIVFF